MKKLDGKVAIITGAGQGLGKSYAKALANEGSRVVIAELNDVTGEATAKELVAGNKEAIFVHCDVSNQEDIKKVIAITVEKYGAIDILINNAQYIPHSTPIVDTTLQSMESAWRTGPLATLFLMQEAYPYLKKNGGHIINVASACGADGFANEAAYGSSKEGVRALTRIAAREFGHDNITVNVILPSAMTPAAKAFAEADPEQFKKVNGSKPIPHLGDPDTELAPVVVFLASDDSKFMTGQSIYIDGGYHFAV